MTTRYFLIKSDDLALIDDSELESAGKLIGTLSRNINDKPLFIWESPMTRAMIRRLHELNWSIYNEQRKPLDPEEFWQIIGPAQQWWKN